MTEETTYPDEPDEFPIEEELPDEPVTVDDIDPFTVADDDCEHIDEFAAAEWKSKTTANERIRTVINNTTSLKSASDIADTALVSETKARETLNELAEEGIVRSQQTESGKLYSRDPDWHLLKQIRQLAGSEALVDQIQRVKQELTAYKSTYETAGPEELLISDRELTQEELDDVSHWRTAKRELSHLKAAYRFKEAKQQTVIATGGEHRQTGEHPTTPADNHLTIQ